MAKSPFSPFGNQPPPPPSLARDRFGNMLEAGHLVLYHPPTDLIFEVIAVHPVVHPGAGQGRAMQITVQSQFNLYDANPGNPNQSLIIVGESQARVAEKAKNNGKVGLDRTAAPAAAEEQPPSDQSTMLHGSVELGDAICSACGSAASELRVGLTCDECGSGTYQKA